MSKKSKKKDGVSEEDQLDLFWRLKAKAKKNKLADRMQKLVAKDIEKRRKKEAKKKGKK